MTPNAHSENNWQTTYHNHQASTDNVMAIQRDNAHCLALDFGLDQNAKVGLMGTGWLNTVRPDSVARLIEWLAGDDYGPFTYIGWSLWPCHPIPTDVRISLVRQNVGDVAICIAAYSLLTRSPWRELAKQPHPPAE